MLAFTARPSFVRRLRHAQRAWRRDVLQRSAAIGHAVAAFASIAGAALLRFEFGDILSRRATALMAIVVAGTLVATWMMIPSRRRHARHLRPRERDLLVATPTVAGSIAAVVHAVLRGSSADAILTYLPIPVVTAALLSNAALEGWIVLHWIRARRAVHVTTPT